MKFQLLLSTILLSLTSVFFLVYPSQKQEEQVITQRNFFKQYQSNNNKLQANDEAAPIITYGIKHIMQVDQFAQDPNKTETEQYVQVIAQCDVQTIYDAENDHYEIAVSYSKVEKSNGEDQALKRNLVMLEDEEMVQDIGFEDGELYDFEVDQGEEEIEERFDQFYLLTVDANSGTVLSIKREAAFEDDQTMNWITQQLINDIFPEMRRESYEHRVIEQDTIGEVAVEYKQKDAGNTIQISKQYDSEDVVKKNIQSLETPEFDYERTIFVEKDTGIVDEGQSNFSFEIGEHQKLQQSQDQDGEVVLEALGEIEGKIQQTFWLVPPTVDDKNIAEEMMRYRLDADFEPLKLSSQNKGDLEFGDGEAEHFQIVDIDETTEVEEVSEEEEFQGEQIQEEQAEKLQAAGDFYKVNELAGVKIFGSRVHLDMIYSGNAQRSNIYADIKVNKRVIKRLVHVSFKNCKTSNRPYSNSLDIPLFRVDFPVFGIIIIKVSAKTRIQYGYDRGVVAKTRYCQSYIKPWFKTALYADGKASLAGVISAGIYAQGNFLDSALNLSATTANGKSSVSLTGTFKAFSVEVGLTYTRISCSFNNVRRKLDAIEEYQEQEEENQQGRRQLGLRRKLRKVRRKAKKVVKKVKRVVKNVNRVIRDGIYIAKNLHKLCKSSKGFKQLHKSSSPTKYRTFYNQSVKYGI